MPSRTPALNRIAADLKATQPPCFICGQAIDYTLPWDHRDAFTVEHIKPRSTHPHLMEDPANCVAAHARCNKGRGDRQYTASLGALSADW